MKSRLRLKREHADAAGIRLATSGSDKGSRGQSIVEFALIAPILVFMLVGILDFSRVFTSMMTIESAAREAADYGAWSSGNWSGDFTDDTSAIYKAKAGMRARACIASRNLMDFVGSTTDCTNPAISIDLIDETGASALNPNGSLKTASNCDQAERTSGTIDLGPCRVKVELTYTFDVIVPLGVDIGGTRLGLPDDVTFTRTSIFAISDFMVDPT